MSIVVKQVLSASFYLACKSPDIFFICKSLAPFDVTLLISNVYSDGPLIPSLFAYGQQENNKVSLLCW